MYKKITAISIAVTAAIFINIVGTGEYITYQNSRENNNLNSDQEQSQSKDDKDIQLGKLNINTEISEFIKNNPKLILDTLNDYYQQREQEKNKLAELSVKDVSEKYSRNHLVPSFGNMSSDNTIVIFTDYNCGYCKKLGNEIDSLLATNKDVKIIISELPILSAKSQYFAKVAQAVWLTYPAKYEEFHKEVLKINNGDENALGAIFKRLNMEFAAVKLQFNSAEDQIKSNHQIAQQLQINGTPALIVNGQLIKGYIDKNKINSLLKG